MLRQTSSLRFSLAGCHSERSSGLKAGSALTTRFLQSSSRTLLHRNGKRQASGAEVAASKILQQSAQYYPPFCLQVETDGFVDYKMRGCRPRIGLQRLLVTMVFLNALQALTFVALWAAPMRSCALAGSL